MARKKITARVVPNFPAKVTGSGGISVDKSNGVYNISTDFDQFSSQEGSILYRGPTNWIGLLRGQDGQVLKSTATSIEWGTSAADQTFVGVQPILVNTVGSTTTTSYNPDFYSANQGALQKRGVSAWEGLDKGTAGQVLTVNGAGTDIEWATPSAATGERNVVWCGNAGGTANDLVLTPVGDPITSYESNVIYAFKPVSGNTGAMTANISGVGVVPILFNGQAMPNNFVRAPLIWNLQYDGTSFNAIPVSIAPALYVHNTGTDLTTTSTQGAIYAKSADNLPYYRQQSNGSVLPLYTPLDNTATATYSTAGSTNSGTYQNTGLELTFTAQTTGKIRITAVVPARVQITAGNTDVYGFFRLLDATGDTNLGEAEIGLASTASTFNASTVTIDREITVPTGGARTYRLQYRIGAGGGNLFICQNSFAASLVIEERNA